MLGVSSCCYQERTKSSRGNMGLKKIAIFICSISIISVCEIQKPNLRCEDSAFFVGMYKISLLKHLYFFSSNLAIF